MKEPLFKHERDNQAFEEESRKLDRTINVIILLTALAFLAKIIIQISGQ